MATRLFCHMAIRQLRSAQIQMSQRMPRFAVNLGIPGQYYSGAQRLHVKVYDKDANLEAQRLANKAKESEEPFAESFTENQAPLTNTSNKREKGSKKFTKEPRFYKKESEMENTLKAARVRDELDITEDADTFGNAKLHIEEDKGDLAEEEFISNPPRRVKKLATREYARIIKEHLNANRLKEAIEVLERRMLKEDRVKPENYIYNLLISGCAKAGYTRKAFSLFTRMRQRGLKVTGGTYTSLFNACANAPSAEDGLGRANHLREIMLEKGYEPNIVNYNAMIKAYGRCHDVKTAYLLADEMMDRDLKLTTETFNFLLQACASDPDFGFRHCLLTWHKMLQRGIKPDYYSFNTVLRCVRDCGFGDLETMQQVLSQILDERQIKQIQNNSTKLLEGSADQLEDSDNKLAPIETNNTIQVNNDTAQLEIPNLLAPRPHLGSLVELSEVSRPHERLLLLGGLTGFLELMKQNNITPDIQCFTSILEVIPPTNAAEKQVILFIRKIGLKSDIDFFNVLIKKRSMRFDYEGAKEVLTMIRTAGLHPDIVTYGVLALGCQTEEAARELLQEMRDKGVRMNVQILGAMLRQGCSQKAFPYINEIMQISLDEQIKPNHIFLRHLHNFYNQCARAIDARHPFTKSKSFKKDHGRFCDKLRLYYEEQGIAGLKLEDAIKKVTERNYDQYKEETVDGIEPLKNEHLVRKQKVRKYIKKIKAAHLKDDDGDHERVSKWKPKHLE